MRRMLALPLVLLALALPAAEETPESRAAKAWEAIAAADDAGLDAVWQRETATFGAEELEALVGLMMEAEKMAKLKAAE